MQNKPDEHRQMPNIERTVKPVRKTGRGRRERSLLSGGDPRDIAGQSEALR